MSESFSDFRKLSSMADRMLCHFTLDMPCYVFCMWLDGLEHYVFCRLIRNRAPDPSNHWLYLLICYAAFLKWNQIKSFI